LRLEITDRCHVVLGVDPRDGGVEQPLDVVGPLERRPVNLAEAGWRADLEDEVLERAGRIEAEQLLIQPLGPPCGVGVDRSELAELRGSRIERVDVASADRPAAVRHPGPTLEARRPERPAVAAPVAGRAAEEAKPGAVDVMVMAHDLTLVDLLRVLAVVEPAGLDD
jgi:hypothetical protein